MGLQAHLYDVNGTALAITIDIGGSEGDGESRLFRSGEGLVICNRGIVDRSDGDGDETAHRGAGHGRFIDRSVQL